MIRREFSLVWAVCFVFLMFEMTSQVKGTSVLPVNDLYQTDQTPGGYGGVFSSNATSSATRRNEITSEEARSQGGRSRQNSDRDFPQRGMSNNRLGHRQTPGDYGGAFPDWPDNSTSNGNQGNSNNRPGKKPKDKGTPSDGKSNNLPDRGPGDKGAPSDRGKSNNRPDKKQKDKDAPSKGKSNYRQDKRSKDKGAPSKPSSKGKAASVPHTTGSNVGAFMRKREIPLRHKEDVPDQIWTETPAHAEKPNKPPGRPDKEN